MSISLVLLPGLDGTGELFQPFLKELAPDIHPIVVSYPTHGPQEYSALVQFVLRQLPSDRPFVLLGESFSGPAAVLVAATRPKNLVGIILCASFIGAPRRFAGWFARWSRFAPLHLMSRLGGPHFLMGRFRAPALRELLVRALAKVPRYTLSARYAAVANVDVRAELSDLELPALYLRASEDTVIPVAAADVFAKTCVRAKVEVIEAPHFLLQCAPERAARVVEEFVRDVASAA